MDQEELFANRNASLPRHTAIIKENRGPASIHEDRESCEAGSCVVAPDDRDKSNFVVSAIETVCTPPGIRSNFPRADSSGLSVARSLPRGAVVVAITEVRNREAKEAG